MNGNTLKIAFLMIVFTMCLIVLFLIGGIVFFKFPLEDSRNIIGMLSISGLFGVIVQSFVHANITESAKNVSTLPEKPPTIAPDASKSAQAVVDYLLFLVCITLVIAGCVSANLQGTGINAQSPEYGSFTANSINAGVSANAN